MSAAAMQITDNEPVPERAVRVIATRIGEVEIGEENVLSFPRGMLGFEGKAEFAVLNLPHPGMEQFKLLQSVDDPELGFVVTEAANAPEAIELADLQDAYKQCDVAPADALTLLIVSIRKVEEGVEMSANLRAPIVIDMQRRIGRQHVMSNGKYPIRFTL